MTPDDQRLLTFEEQHPAMTGRKPAQVRAELGISMTVYFTRLHRLIDDPTVEAAYPVLVHRLQRLRAARNRTRTSRRF